MAKIRAVYELYGFEAVETPFIEYTDALGKFLPDQDRPNEGVFSFKDDDEQWLSLRYDLTAPLARYVAEHYERLPKPYRSYRAGWVFRNEKPGPGRFRQFMQFDADTVGAASPAADAEICMMAADCLEALGIKRGDYVVKVNNRKVLDGVMEAIGLGGPENVGRRLIVLRAIDKLDRLGPEGVRALLGAGRKDESGDFTKGAGLERATALEQHPRPGIPRTRRAADKPDRLLPRRMRTRSARRARGARRSWDRSPEDVPRLREIANWRRRRDTARTASRSTPSVVRGLEYYTGPVFEAELTFETPGEDGKPIRFGSVGGGGRYDGLVARFRGEPVPATGFSIGISRLLSALRAIKQPDRRLGREARPRHRRRARPRPYGRLPAPGDELARRRGSPPKCISAPAASTRSSNTPTSAASLCAVIQGSNEREAAGGRQVVIRDLTLGAELAKASKDRADYLELRQRAQFAAPEAELVARVREVLERSGS